MSSKQSDFYNKYIEKLQKKAKEAVEIAQKEAFAEYFEVAEKKIHELYQNTIIDFYADYTPSSFYKRRDSLKNLLQTERSKSYLEGWFDPSKISYRNGYSESSTSDGVEGGLYDIVFRQGWHGGAMVNGSMLYPVGGKPYDGKYDGGRCRPYEDRSYKYGWTPAKRAPISPLDDFLQRLNEYQKEEYQRDFEKIWNKHKSNIKIDMY